MINLYINQTYKWNQLKKKKQQQQQQRQICFFPRDAKFPGILRAVSFHREYWEFCGNIGNFGEYMETLVILK